MNVRVTYPTLGSQLKRLAQLSGKELHVVLMEQGLLFAKDAQKLTPPFGNAPITESIAAQMDIGKAAVANQMGRLFQSRSTLEILSKPRTVGHAINRAIQDGDLLTAEELLRKAGIRTHGVVEQPTKELHNRWRTNWGRVRTSRSYVVTDRTSLGRLVEDAQAKVGTGKAGWNPAIRGLGAKLKASLNRRIAGASIPALLKRQRESGRFTEIGTGEKTVIAVLNEVPYLQKHAGHIMTRAWQNRLRNLPKQIAQIEKHIEKKLNATR